MSKLVYILSDNRSGSTLLDQLLGAHPDVMSLGEVHHLVAYARQDRRLYNPVHPLVCSCDEPVSHCRLWTAVEEKLGRRLDTLDLHLRFIGPETSSSRLRSVMRRIPRRILRRAPQLLLNPYISRLFNMRRIGADSFAVFDAVTEVTNAEIVVDSSKSAFRYRALYDFAPDRVFGIILVRDYRGVVHSKMKRGQSLELASREWAERIQQANELTANVPGNQLMRLSYEELCRQPRSEMIRICEFVGLRFDESLLTRPSSGIHHLGGSPSKFDPTRRKVELDESYMSAFSDKDLESIRKIVSETAQQLGYD